jgi:hypothetical protein
MLPPRIEARLDPRDEVSNFELLYEETYVVATGVNDPWARRLRIKFSDLPGDARIRVRFILREDFRSAGFDFPPATVFTHVPDVRMTLLASGRYLTLVGFRSEVGAWRRGSCTRIRIR